MITSSDSERERPWVPYAIDLLALLAVIVLVTSWLWGIAEIFRSTAVVLGLLVAFGILTNLAWEGLYDAAQSRLWPVAVALVTRAVVTGAASFALAGFVFGVGDGARRWVGLVSLLWFVHLALHHGIRAALRKNLSRVIVAGSPGQAIAMRDLLTQDRRRAHHVLGYVVDDPSIRERVTPIGSFSPGAESGKNSALGAIDDLPSLVEVYNADQVIFCMDGLTGGRFAAIARSLSRRGVDVALTGIGDIAPRRVGISHIEGQPIVSIAPSVASHWELAVKRLVDMVLATVLVVVLSPLFAIVSVLIRVVDGASPIFRQHRVGKGGEVFTIYKFQTMVTDAESMKIDLTNELEGPIFKMESDPRITRLGGVLRKTSIDELPQLFNVLRGEMSLVGPRPFLESEVNAAPAQFRERETVTPGMTGAWQVSGRSDTDFDELEELDRWYVDNWSLGEDLGILAKTVPAVLRQKGAR